MLARARIRSTISSKAMALPGMPKSCELARSWAIRPQPAAVLGGLDGKGGAAAEDLGQAAGVLWPSVLEGHHRAGEAGGQGDQHLAEGVQGTGRGDHANHPQATVGGLGSPEVHGHRPRRLHGRHVDSFILRCPAPGP